MTPVEIGATLLAVALVVSLPAWRRGRTRWLAPLATAAVAAAAAVAALTATDAPGRTWAVAVVVLGGAVAVLGGGPLTTAVFALVDGRGADDAGSVRLAAEVLRGGAWIGVLERAAVYASILAGWPEGIAITLAVKGLGRYPELRHEERAGIAERFLIGTFLSVLWAAACAGTVTLLVH